MRMFMMRNGHRVSVLLLALSLGCAYGKVDKKIERSPEFDMGVGATILMPGQAPPALNDPQNPNAPGHAPGTGNLSYVGGAKSNAAGHIQEKRSPFLFGPLAAPFVAAGLVAKKAADKAKAAVGSEEEVAQAAAPPPTPQQIEALREEQRLQALERQLAGPSGTSPAPTTQGSAVPPLPLPLPPIPVGSDSGAGATGGSMSLSDELQLLQRRVRPRGELAQPVQTARANPSALPDDQLDRAPAPQLRSGVADRVNDRDGDGRPDHWEYREGESLVREIFDEDGDGRADRTLHYDGGTGVRAREEEDSDQDGNVDTWIEYREGEIHRRRSDRTGNGHPDTWSFYRAGELARVEEDGDGDGFRDRVAFYDGGQISREELDRNGDGRPDRVTWYDSAEKVRQVDEDQDGDGVVDVRSHYKGGRLQSRELVSDEFLDREGTDLESAPGFSEGPAEGENS